MVTVTDGQIDTSFVPSANNAAISALVLTTVPYSDTGSDGMPDTWETEFFGGLEKDFSGDEDGDGLGNGNEFIAGTSPVDPLSVLRVKSITGELGPGFTLRWDSAAGRTYTVLRSTGLDGDWAPVSGSIPGTGGELSFTDDPATIEKAFYVVQVDIILMEQ